jgi:hypothetical protein
MATLDPETVSETAALCFERLGYRQVDCRIVRRQRTGNVFSRYRLPLSLLQPFHPVQVRLSSLKWSCSRWTVKLGDAVAIGDRRSNAMATVTHAR